MEKDAAMEHWTVLASSLSASSRKCMIGLYTKCVAENASLEVLPSAQSLPRDLLSDLIESVITAWVRPSTHAALEHRLAQMKAEYEKNARIKEGEYKRLDAVNADLKARANALRQRVQRDETLIRQFQNEVQTLENELRRQRDGLGHERDNLKPEGDNLKREGDKLERELDKLKRTQQLFRKRFGP
jgi:predicted RNase H-like nuclease (RuvC/YqgF family)